MSSGMGEIGELPGYSSNTLGSLFPSGHMCLCIDDNFSHCGYHRAVRCVLDIVLDHGLWFGAADDMLTIEEIELTHDIH